MTTRTFFAIEIMQMAYLRWGAGGGLAERPRRGMFSISLHYLSKTFRRAQSVNVALEVSYELVKLRWRCYANFETNDGRADGRLDVCQTNVNQ